MDECENCKKLELQIIELAAALIYIQRGCEYPVVTAKTALDKWKQMKKEIHDAKN